MLQRTNLLFSGFVIFILMMNITAGTQVGVFSKVIISTSDQSLDARGHLKQAAILHNAKEYDKAIEEYWLALTLDPSLVMAYRGFGNANVEKGSPQEAIDRFTELLNKDHQKNGRAYYGIGNIYYKTEAYDVAQQAFEKAIEQDPKLAIAYNGLAVIYNKQGDAQEAEFLARKAIQIDPSLGLAHNTLASVLLGNRTYKEVTAEYEDQIANQPATLTADQTYLAAASYYGLQNYDKAETTFQQVVDRYPDSYWGDNSYYNLTHIYMMRNEYEKTISTIEKAITAYPVSDNSFVFYYRLGGLYSQLGDYEKTRAMYEIALTKYVDQGILESNAATTLTQMEELIRVIDLGGGEALRLIWKITPLLKTDECQQSYPLAEQLLDISRKVDFILGQLVAQETIVGCLDDLGIPPDQRIESIQNYLELAVTSHSTTSEAEALIELADVYMAIGKYQDAFSIYSQLLGYIPKLNLDANVDLVAAIYDGNALWFWMNKDYEEALKYMEQAISVLDKYSESKEMSPKAISARSRLATTYGNTGAVYEELDNLDKAVEYNLKALKIYQDIGKERSTVGVYLHLGRLYSLTGEYIRAESTLKNGLSLAEKFNIRHSEARAHFELGDLYAAWFFDVFGEKYQDKTNEQIRAAIKSGNAPGIEYLRECILEYQKAIEIGEKTTSISFLYDTQYKLGVMYDMNGEYEKSAEALKTAVRLMEQASNGLNIDDLTIDFMSQYGHYYSKTINELSLLKDEANKAGDYSRAQEYLRDEFYYVERSRARALLNAVGNKLPLNSKLVDSALIEQQNSLLNEIGELNHRLQMIEKGAYQEGNENEIADIIQQLENKRQAYADLLIQIKLRNPEMSSLISVEPASLEDIQNILDTNTTLIEYYMMDERTLVFVITHQDFEVVEISVPREEITSAIMDFRGFANLNNPNPSSLTQLYNWLILPIKGKLKTPVIGVVPHGVLNYLPFAALSDGQRYLSDDYILFNLSSASTLGFLQEKRKPGSGTLLALGNPTTDASALKFAEQEVQSISKLYKSQILIGEQATESAFIANAGEAKIIHLAAHGEYKSNNPLFSTIYLASDVQNDGHLEAHEIYGLDLTKSTDLVVLSACQTQIGTISGGDEVESLARAFIYAGAPTVVASLWNVDDAATSLLMERFYIHLRDGMSKAQALQQAQFDVKAQYPHPYYWASFVLTGDTGVFIESASTTSSKPALSNIKIVIGILFCASVIVLLMITISNRRRKLVAQIKDC